MHTKPATHMEMAKENLGFFARQLVREHYGSFWEDETRTLPWTMRGLRRKYKDFCDEFIRPSVLAIDLDLENFDRDKLYYEYAKRGFATELLPWPIGTMKYANILGGGLFASMLKVEELCAACPGQTMFFGAHDLGMGPLLMSASPTVLFRWIIPTYQKIKNGEKCIWAFAITEPGAGSDVEDTYGATKAKVITRAKKVSGGYRISGRKVFITGGSVADYYTLFACLDDEGLESWTCFVIEKGMEGFSLGRREKKLGQKAGDATELILDNIFVPQNNRIGKERSGWALNRLVLTGSRPVVGGVGVGIARGAFEHCLDFCQKTKLGNKKLVEYQDIQLELADMLIKVIAARVLVWNTALRYFPPYPSTSAAAKVFATDTANEVSASAMSLMSDHSYLHKNNLEKILRDARVTQIYEGTNQINRLALMEDLFEEDIY
jgi:alkylation response protein AidB-like acyl-CoA dehydrogenase